MLVSGAQCVGLFHTSPTRRVVTVCHQQTFLQYHWLYSLCCAFHPHDLFIYLITGSLHLLMAHIYFLHASHLPPLWQPSVCSGFFCLFVCFLDSTNEWNHTIFAFVWLASFSIIPSRSIHAVTGGESSFILTPEGYYVACIHPGPFTLSSVDGHLDCSLYIFWLL